MDFRKFKTRHVLRKANEVVDVMVNEINVLEESFQVF